MKKNLLSIVPVFIGILCTSAFAQNVHPVSGEPRKYCYTDEATVELYKKHPNLKAITEIIEKQQENQKINPETNQPPVYIIPVVVHILHNWGPENIPDANVKDAIRILNEDFRKLNADTTSIVAAFKAIAADSEIEFRLAQLDPNGNCTNGIDRIVTLETYIGDNGSKLNQWPRNRYLNIWTVNTILSGAAGYTYLPSSVNGQPSIDGIVILYNYFGSLAPSSYGVARANTHEVGHWINLLHPWGGTNNPGVSCGNDAVSDTPITMGWTTCNLTSNDVCTTGVQENVQNYMDYAYCDRMFTQGQSTRMRNALNSNIAQRMNLWQPANLTLTGVGTTPQLCAADFLVSKRLVCAGTSVTFTDLSWNATPTSWQWDIDNDGNTDYTTQNPTHTYNTPGVYGVKFTVSDGVTTIPITKTSYIVVLGNTATSPSNYSEGFENTGYPYNDCYTHFVSGTGPVWNRTTSAFYSGSASLTLNNYASTTKYVEEAIFPSIDFTFATGPQLTFRVAYAQKDTADADKLRVLVSNNCGSTWVQKYVKAASTLTTAGTLSSSFTPSFHLVHWRQETVNLANYAGFNNFRFKFEFTGNGGTGNNLYIDDINITVTNTGVAEEFANGFGLNVYPNPFTESTIISFNLSEKQTVSLGVYDIIGKEVIGLSNSSELKSLSKVLLFVKRSSFLKVCFIIVQKYKSPLIHQRAFEKGVIELLNNHFSNHGISIHI